MVGWSIGIAQQTPQERDASSDKRAAVIASWKTGGVGGREWLDELVDEGKARALSEGGYPSRYVCLAGDVLPLIENGPSGLAVTDVSKTGHALFGSATEEFFFDREKVKACPPEQVMTIDVWDLG